MQTSRKPMIRVIASMASGPMVREMKRAERNVSQMAMR
jgi:hypothetical protein